MALVGRFEEIEPFQGIVRRGRSGADRDGVLIGTDVGQ